MKNAQGEDVSLKVWRILEVDSLQVQTGIEIFEKIGDFYEKIQEYDNGKVTLIVNVASKCGEVDQYKELVDIQEKYKDDLQVFQESQTWNGHSIKIAKSWSFFRFSPSQWTILMDKNLVQ